MLSFENIPKALRATQNGLAGHILRCLA